MDKDDTDNSDHSDDFDEFSTYSMSTVHYYMQPVPDYENSFWTFYENCCNSDGYEVPLADEQKFSEDNDYDDCAVENTEKVDGRSEEKAVDTIESDEEIDEVLTYEIIPVSPVELLLFID